MIIEYPKALYNNTDKMTTTVSSRENQDIVSGYFKDTLDHALLPYTIIPESEALRLYTDAVREVHRDISDDETKLLDTPKEEKQDIDLKSLKYLDLVKYAKKVMKQTGVKFPVRATRDKIEKSIREALNVNNNKRSDNESVS